MAGIKIKIQKRVLIIFFVIIAVSFSVVIFYMSYKPYEPITAVNYYGKIINFRVDLRKADGIPVYPSDSALYLELMHPLVQNITIAVKPVNGTENAYYGIEAFEITKLLYGYARIGTKPGFNAINVSSYEHLPGKIQNPIIALVHPVYSDETAIRIENHVIFIKAKNYEEFDLATVKFLIVALGIELEG